MKKNVKNNVTRIVLSVLILALIPVMHLLATERPMSYEEYFSQERELIASPFATSDSNWESEPFYVTESTVNWLKNAHPEEKDSIKVGNIYQQRKVGEEVHLILLAKGQYTNCNTSGSLLYLAEAEDLSCMNLITGEINVLFEGKDNVSLIFPYDEVVFFQAGNTIFLPE